MKCSFIVWTFFFFAPDPAAPASKPVAAPAATPASAPAEPTESKWYEFPAETSYALTEEDDLLSVRIPIKLLPGAKEAGAADLKTVDVNRADMSSGTARAQDWLPALKIDTAASQPHTLPSFVISIPPAELPPGTYTLVVEFAPQTPKDPKVPPQRATFKLERPQPKLVSQRSLSMFQQRGLWWGSETDSSEGILTLTEEGRKTGVRGLTIADVRTAPKEPEPETGALDVDVTKVVVPAGGDAQVTVTPTGEFPLGKSSGKLRVTSLDLAETTVVEYEVMVRRSYVWIAVMAILGAAVGWLTRIGLQNYKAWLNAKIEASEAEEALQKAKAAIPDATFQLALDRAEKLLQDVAGDRVAATITKAAADAKTALTAAETELNGRRKALSDVLVPLHRKLYQGWQLPPEAAKLLVTTRTLASEMMALAEAQDIKLAQHKLDDEMPAQRLELAVSASNWRAEATKYLEEIGKFPPALSEVDKQQLTDAIAAWKTKFGTPQNYSAVNDSELGDELTTTHDAWAHAKRLQEDLAVNNVSAARWLVALFPRFATQTPFADVLAIAGTNNAETKHDLEDPGPHRGQPQVHQQAELTAWKAALRSTVRSDDEFKDVDEKLELGQWVAAAKAAKVLSEKPAPGQPQLLADEIPSTVFPAAPASHRMTFHASPVSPTTSDAEAIAAVPKFEGTRSERYVLARAASLASMVQSIIFCIIFILLAYGLYGSQWVGTSREMLALFAWAFGLDMTADSLTPLLKTVSSKTATG